jgi:hypothetical protein
MVAVASIISADVEIGLPTNLSELIAKYFIVGISGSRQPSPRSVVACRLVTWAVSPRARVFVGCARGIDSIPRTLIPGSGLNIFSAHHYGKGRSSFAARSCAMIRSLVANKGLLCSFPDTTCPKGLEPSWASAHAFSGRGSGSWASLSFAIGLELPCLIYLPEQISPPPSWELIPVGGGWFTSPAPSYSQFELAV